MDTKLTNILKISIFKYLLSRLPKDSKFWKHESFGGVDDGMRNLPYVAFGKSETRLWQSVTFDGQHHQIYLDLYCKAVEQVEAKLCACDIISALHCADFPVKGHALIEIKYEESEYTKLADRCAYHVRLKFTVLTISD